ncbi:hypothetical protein C6376_40290 [Streptomyces sp. P3]|nr:hypothetical protein C6376_40290 [Streptomyces sp. P3]
MSAPTHLAIPDEATAVEAAAAHHAHLAGVLTERVEALLSAVEDAPSATESVRADLVAFCDRELLPHVAAEERTLYRAAHAVPEARLLVESLVDEHGCLAVLVDALRGASTPARAAADARALQVCLVEHLAKDRGFVLPLLAAAPDVSLTTLLTDLEHRVAQNMDLVCGDGIRRGKGEQGAAHHQESGGCACGGAAEHGVREPDEWEMHHGTVFGAQTAFVATTHRAASVIRQHLENSVLRGADLTWTAFVVLWVVWARGESETRHVAQGAGISKGTLTGVSRTLERKALIRRSAHPGDGRLVLLSLTEEGEALMRRLFPAFDQEETFVAARLSDEECRSLVDGLRQVVLQVEEQGAQRRRALLAGAPPAPRRGGRRRKT